MRCFSEAFGGWQKLRELFVCRATTAIPDNAFVALSLGLNTPRPPVAEASFRRDLFEVNAKILKMKVRKMKTTKLIKGDCRSISRLSNKLSNLLGMLDRKSTRLNSS